MPRGNIVFAPENPTHRTAAARITDGKYSLEMTAGARKVKIMATKDNAAINQMNEHSLADS